MKRNTKNLLIAVTAIVGIICIVNAVWLIVQSGSVAGWFTDYRNIVYGDGAAENGSKIVWERRCPRLAVLYILWTPALRHRFRRSAAPVHDQVHSCSQIRSIFP